MQVCYPPHLLPQRQSTVGILEHACLPKHQLQMGLKLSWPLQEAFAV